MDPITNSETYWSIPKCFLKNKILCIPPFFHENRLITDSKQKANSFNTSWKTLLLINNSRTTLFSLPSRRNHWRSSVKHLLLNISQNLRENTSARVSFGRLRLAALIKKRLQYSVFLWIFFPMKFFDYI